jgi:hypothetical protein
MQKLRQRKRLKLLLLLACISSIAIWSCTKIDTLSVLNTPNGAPNPTTFFVAAPNTDPTVLRVLNNIKNRNNKTEFVTKFASENGFAYWDKAVITTLDNKDLNGSQSIVAGTNELDTLVIIPIVLKDSNTVNGYILAKINNGIRLCYGLAKDYKNYDFNNSATKLRANGYSALMMLLNKQTFNIDRFEITDSRLFTTLPSDSATGKKIVIITTPTANTASVLTVTTGTVCMTTQGSGCLNCIVYHPEICYSTTIDIQIPDGGIGVTPTGDGGAGGASGGGEEIPHIYPCIPNPNLVNNNVVPGGSLPECPPPTGGLGWLPTPISSVNPCDSFITSLQNDATFAAKFNELMHPNVLGDNVEKGFVVQDRVNHIYTPKTGYPNATGATIDYGVLSNISGLLHSHYNGTGEMFSPKDIISLAHSFIENEGSDLSNLFVGVTTNTGPYLVKITDTAKFRRFANKIYGDSTKEKKFIKKYKDEFRYSGAGAKNLNELGFVNMLSAENNNGGITLYRGNGGCNQWTALKIEYHFEGSPTVGIQNCF